MKKQIIIIFLEVVGILGFASVSQAAVSQHMDCFVGSSSNGISHDLAVNWENGTISLSYSVPGEGQDEWVGPYEGAIDEEEDLVAYKFSDLTILELPNPREDWDKVTGNIRIRGGRQRSVICLAPFKTGRMVF